MTITLSCSIVEFGVPSTTEASEFKTNRSQTKNNHFSVRKNFYLITKIIKNYIRVFTTSIGGVSTSMKLEKHRNFKIENSIDIKIENNIKIETQTEYKEAAPRKHYQENDEKA